ncbi:MAG TPA: HAD family hydrolase [Candidatus Thermoplasmatota archaeon]|nr:HAD family hydrolase [Candidatus Thermoplasmatota archaeon]
MTAPPAVFLDRDGTLHVDMVRSVDLARLQLTPGAAEAMRLWREAGWRIVLVTNQSGIGRGLYTVADMERFHEELQARLGARFDAVYFCPHLPEDGCACRKPKPGMLLQAMRERAIDPARAVFVGDAASDVQAAKAAGVRSVAVAPPGSPAALAGPDHVAPDLAEAARWTLARQKP